MRSIQRDLETSLGAARPGVLWVRDRAKPQEGQGSGDTDVERDDPIETERVLRCAACDLDVARIEDVFEVGQPGPKVFVNPAGWVHEVLPVRQAYNTRHFGPFVPADTWFPGYAWQHCICAGCGQHLGWKYFAVAGAEPGVFWGLRKVHIKGL